MQAKVARFSVITLVQRGRVDGAAEALDLAVHGGAEHVVVERRLRRARRR